MSFSEQLRRNKSFFSKAVASEGQLRSEDGPSCSNRCLTRAELVRGLFHAAVQRPPAIAEKFHCVSDSVSRSFKVVVFPPAGAASLMKLHSKGHCHLIVLITVFTTGSVSAVGLVKVNLHDSATLPCSERCSGLVRWTVFRNPTDPLAECDQTSCRSVKEGYQMIRDLYLKGNHSLIITDADFSKRGWYTSDCDGKDLCDVKLQIEPLNTTVQMEPGESLVLKLDVSDPVEVIYNSTDTAGPSSGQICSVDGRPLQCKPEYTQRASVTSALELRNMTPSDSGVYTVMNKSNKEVIHTYTVTIRDVQDSEIWKRACEKGHSDGYLKGVGFAALAIVIGVFFLGVFAVPWVRPLMDRCVQMLRSNDSSYRSQSEEKESDHPLTSNDVSQSSEE
ncbi:hypothetical protein MHYP_G00263240 [Metynnis hypsauchen]